MVTELPETVQIDVVDELKVTANPDEAVAEIENGVGEYVWLLIVPKVMD
jgi:hypothetical protein